MSINFLKINGTNPNFDYKSFHIDVTNFLRRTCKDAKVYCLNNFPVVISTNSDIDLLIIIAIDDVQGNYFRVKIDDKWVYLHNLILPIKFVNEHADSKLNVENDLIIESENELDFSFEYNSLKYGIRDYLMQRCGMRTDQIFPHPIIFLKNDQVDYTDNLIIGPSLKFEFLIESFKRRKVKFLTSYPFWLKENYIEVKNDIKAIIEQASKDSQEGFLTKSKIERLGRQMSNHNEMINSLGRELIIIKGKAGSGKSTELLLLTLKAMESGKGVYFLTYNKLLVFELSRVVKSFKNSRSDDFLLKKKSNAVDTLHSFFYRLSKKLGVQLVMSEERVNEIISTLKKRSKEVIHFLMPLIEENGLDDLNVLKEGIQNSLQLDKGTKEVGIDFLKFLNYKVVNIENIRDLLNSFINKKEKDLSSLESNGIFLKDYYGVLKNTLLQLNNPSEYFTENGLNEKIDLLSLEMNLNEKHYELDENGNETLKESSFREITNRKVGGFKNGRTLFVDEGQDCHPMEKEILFKVFGEKNLVVASGGKEQLIRHVELCNWKRFNGREVEFSEFTKRKSYRTKRSVGELCNFIGNEFGVELNLEFLSSEDYGEIIIDTRKEVHEEEILELINGLSEKGNIHGCSEYESLLLLNNAQNNKGERAEVENSYVINEYSNIEEAVEYERQRWPYLEMFKNRSNHLIWDGTLKDKTQFGIPYPSDTRLINYESCRGLEAWSVACFGFDEFFDKKKSDKDAEKYLIENEKGKNMQDAFLGNEARKSMYAATWALMALTRAIDTVYIQIDLESELGQIFQKFINLNKSNVRVIAD